MQIKFNIPQVEQVDYFVPRFRRLESRSLSQSTYGKSRNTSLLFSLKRNLNIVFAAAYATI